MSDEDLTLDDLRKIYQAINESVYRGAGAGSFYGQYQTVLRGLNKHGTNPLPTNTELSGFTFITRPRLNLATSSIRQDRILSTLDTLHETSLPFMIRCLLDTKFSTVHSDLANKCPFLEARSPFIIPMSNCITNISGWPDYVIDTETTAGGFFSEDFTFAKGSDRLNRTYDLNIEFREIQGGIILTLAYIWSRWIDLVTKGDVIAYHEDIANNRLEYTCSIYCFTLDPSLRCISKWAKATGCFPISVPIGLAFNMSNTENFISAMTKFSIPFKANKVEYMDPIILLEFNMLTERYWPALRNVGSLTQVPAGPEYNYKGLPHIDLTRGLNELNFYENNTALKDPLDNTKRLLNDKFNQANADKLSTLTEFRNKINV